MKKARALRIVALFLAISCLLLLGTSCTSARPEYTTAVQEGQTAAQEMLAQNVGSAIQVALVNKDGVVWTEGFGLADREKGITPADTTMFGIGSVSKMFATVAAMRLVDKGLIDLDRPLVYYLPDFTMASPDCDKITVRMLLNHSSGLPGSDYRNLMTASYRPGYLDQMLETISHERLKAAPGYTTAYCNDGFTLIEALVRAITGQSYAEFVKAEILDPLGMANTVLPVDPLPEGSFAKAYKDGKPLQQEVVSTLASGGVYSTASDMAQLARVFLNGGAVGNTRILSEQSVVAMGESQIPGTFQPIESLVMNFGLGWDTVTQPGMKAVDVLAWCKGGDTDQYHAALLVAPETGLAVVVLGASAFSSSSATVIAERVLMRALVEDGRLAAFPEPLQKQIPATAEVPDGLLESIAGEYGSGSALFRLVPQPDGSVVAQRCLGNDWTPGSSLTYRSDGSFASDAEPLNSYRVVSAGDSRFLALRLPMGYGHYTDEISMGQRVESNGRLSPAWSARVAKSWVLVNETPESFAWQGLDPRLGIIELPELPGLIAVYPSVEAGNVSVLDPSESDTRAGMMFANSRDLNDLEIFAKDNAEWVRFGSYVYRPVDTIPALSKGTASISIGSEGYGEWRSITGGDTAIDLSIENGEAWRLYSFDGEQVQPLADGFEPGTCSLPAGQKAGWLLVFGQPGQSVQVQVQAK